ncbi:hypothetical protein [Enterovirga rhinocerotis]|uniref:Uncharacterized protein n=1 Tax=Enterovirga rhinocerotis TaxID=1339210 RepID=A0A4R7BXT9_9HYPH|nr:hypothetical protein [Enterovirga rhinocerotis]TDR90333.1 hypothetical protein EV668_3184 [Enterovirga rhinocerotis]
MAHPWKQRGSGKASSCRAARRNASKAERREQSGDRHRAAKAEQTSYFIRDRFKHEQANARRARQIAAGRLQPTGGV